MLMLRKFFLLFSLLAACAFAQSRVYELRTYTCYAGKLEALKANFRDHNIELLKRHSLVIPPPNVTGSLHMGHMFEHSIIDARCAGSACCGVNTLWVPGTDHAGIATQIMVERQLAEEGLTRHDLGREKFEARVWKWKEEYGGRIVEQMKRAGVSCDWSRAALHAGPGLSRAVREAFVRLYEKGLIYRGQYMVNWCPRCQTALSDLEVEHEETQGNLWHIVYPVIGSDLKLWSRPRGRKPCWAIPRSPSIRRSARGGLRGQKVRSCR
jgi:valyl-tRNA synthetase